MYIEYTPVFRSVGSLHFATRSEFPKRSIDSTSIAVCHPKRVSRNKVFKGIAKLGKTTNGWFYGLKLHVIINENGEF
jgi:hypothetical protein